MLHNVEMKYHMDIYLSLLGCFAGVMFCIGFIRESTLESLPKVDDLFLSYVLQGGPKGINFGIMAKSCFLDSFLRF